MMSASIRVTTSLQTGPPASPSGGPSPAASAVPSAVSPAAPSGSPSTQVGLEGYLYSDQPVKLADAGALPSIAIRGVRLHAVTEIQAVQHVLDQLAAGKGGWVVTPNLDHLRRVSRDRVFRALYTHANLVVADGMPLVWASRLQGTPLPERVAGSSLILSLTAGAAKANRSVFLLGGDPGTADSAATILRERNPNPTVAGTHCPELGIDKGEQQLAALLQRLAETTPKTHI